MPLLYTSFFGVGGGAAPPEPGADPFFDSVVLLVGFDEEDGADDAPDESLSDHNLTFGTNAEVDTSQFKFGTASLFLPGNDRVFIPDSSDWDFDTGNLTIEAFIRFADLTVTTQTWLAQFDNLGSQRNFIFRLITGNTLQFIAFPGGSTPIFTASGAWEPVIDTWYHVAAVRNGTDIFVFADGVLIGSDEVAGGTELFDSNQVLDIGEVDGVQRFNGWIDEVRITKGVARYTGAFTPPSQAFPRFGP
jgi:hypothetical protein